MLSKSNTFFPLYHASLKQSWRTILAWTFAVLLLATTSYLAYNKVFLNNTADQKELIMTVSKNPAFNLIFGKPSNLLIAEGFTAWRTVVLGGFLSSLMSIFLVVNLTRAKEDSGEAELIASNPIGRYTQITVGVAVAWTASLFVGFMVMGVVTILGSSVQVSSLLGISLAMTGIMFSSVAALTSQLGTHRSVATSFAVSLLGLAYLIRGFADTVNGTEWVSNFSPLGWIQKLDIAGANNYWPIIIYIIFTFIVLIITYYIVSRRDFAQGVIASHPGLTRAKLAKTAPGLIMKLNRNSLLGWNMVFVLLGTTFGYMVASANDLFQAEGGISQIIQVGDKTNISFAFEFAKSLFNVMGIIAAVYGVLIIMRLYTEEYEHRIEPLLAGALSRSKLFLTNSLLAIAAPAIAIILGSGAIAIVATLNNTDMGVWDVIGQAIFTIPAILILVSIGIATIGARPAWRHIAWIAIASSFALTILGPIMKLDDKILALSPFWHIPDTSQAGFSYASTIAMIAIAVTLIIIGFVGYNKRDIARV